jgi:hypothetical protein
MFKYQDPINKTISAETRKALQEQIHKDINAYCVKKYTEEHRHHLGASIIGRECWRELWYGFRWVKSAMFDGRMLRLFNRGHREEAVIIELLRGIGCQVWEVDPTTQKQFRIYGVQGHYGGSMDSGGLLPYFPDLPMLMEYKTHNLKSFNYLVNKGVRVAKPEHYSQMCEYGKEYNFKYGLYFAVCKDDDEIWPEIVELDHSVKSYNEKKATEIIYAETPPPKLSANPAYFKCKYCSFYNVCHFDEPIEKNCRSCKKCKPVQDGQWYCQQYNDIVPKDFLKKVCPQHEPIC